MNGEAIKLYFQIKLSLNQYSHDFIYISTRGF